MDADGRLEVNDDFLEVNEQIYLSASSRRSNFMNNAPIVTGQFYLRGWSERPKRLVSQW
ncbi:hypothetical protein ES703_41484 [subsurface metagenome]